MWATLINIILTTLIPISVFGYNDPAMKISIDYFLHRHVKLVCLLCYKDNEWIQSFAKNAFAASIAVSRPVPANRSIKTDLGKCLQQKFVPIGILINAGCDNFEDIMYFASQNGYFDASHYWFIIENSTQEHANEITMSDGYGNLDNLTKVDGTDINEEDIVETARFMDYLNISVDSDITVAKEKGIRYDLYEVFNFGKMQGGNRVVNYLGTWTFEDGLTTDFNTCKYYRRWDFQGITLKQVAVIAKQPKDFKPDMMRHPLTLGLPQIALTGTVLLNEIADLHNFRFNYTITDRYLGDFTLNNSKVAATSLHFRMHDITPILRFLSETTERVDFAHPPTVSIDVRYFYRIPTYGPGKFENQFLTPLSTEVWGYVVLVMVLCMVSIMLAAKLEQRPALVQYAVFSVTAFFCQQFFEDNCENQIRKKLVGRKILLLVTGVSCVLLFNYYTSSVVSWLLNGPPPSINSLEELLESPLQLIFEDVGYARSWLLTPEYYFNRRNTIVEDKIRKTILSKKEINTVLFPLEDGFKMMQGGGYAFHTDVNSANKLISRSFTQSELCELGSLQSMEVTPLYVALQKHSPFKEFFVWSLARLSERGIISYVQRRTSSPSVKCEGSSPRALTLGGAAPAFLLLFGGFVLGTLILFLERLWKKMEDKRARRFATVDNNLTILKLYK